MGRAKRARVRRTGTALAATLALVSSLLAACDGTYDLPADRRWESTHLTYLTRAADSQSCPDVLGPLEEHFALLQDYLGFDWPPGAKVTYEKMLDPTDYHDHVDCEGTSTACTRFSMAESPEPMDLHELVHAYLWPTGSPPKVLVEGVAVVLACTGQDFGQPKPAETWDQLASLGYGAPGADGSAGSIEVYDAGAWLVGYLLTAYDPHLFTTIYRRLPSDADAGTMDAAFRDVYGQSLEAIWMAALAGPTPRDACIWQCSRPSVPLDGTPVATAGVCGTVDLFHPFTLASPALLNLTSKGAASKVKGCDETPFLDWSAAGVLNLYELAAGSYFVESSPDVGTMSLTEPPSGLLAPTCAQATNLAPFAGLDGFRLAGPNTTPQWFLPLPPPPAGASQLDLSSGGALASVCASCDPASCVLPLQPIAAGSWAPGQTVSVAVGSFPPGATFQVFLDWISF